MSDVTELPSNKVEEPAFNGFQLIGDSQFLRFSESLLNLKRQEKDGFSLLGLCVSGQRISHLLRRVRNDSGYVSEKIVLMIGTNDLLGGTIIEEMCDGFKKLVELLSQNAKKMILLTLPPVLKLEKNRDHWDRLKKFNDFVKEFHDDEKFFVGDAYAEFVIPKESSNVRSYVTNSKKSQGSTSTCDSKDDPIGLANDEVLPCQIEPSRSPCDDDKIFPPRSETPEAHQQQSSSDLNNDEDCCPGVMSSAVSDGVPITPSATMELLCDSAMTPDCAAIPPDSVETPPEDTAISDGATTLPGDTPSLSHGAVSSSSDVVTPSCGASTTSDLTTSGGGMSPSGSSTVPSVDEMSISGDITTTAGDEISSSDSVTMLSVAGLSTSGGTTAELSGEMSPGIASSSPGGAASSDCPATPSDNASALSSGKRDTFTPPSNKKRAHKRKRDSFSSDSDSKSKRKRYSYPSGDSYQLKREFALKRKRYSYSSGDRYHNESVELGSTDKVEIENADKIRAEYFEKYYDSDCRRPDLIHLNADGLRVIKRIIEHIIDAMREEKPAV